MTLPTTEITGRSTQIPGLLAFDLTYVGDERGYFQEKYQRAKLVQAGMPADFQVVQTSLAYNKHAGATRGFHAEPWDKYVSLVTGKGFAAFVDLRAGDDFGKLVTLELTPTTAAFVPRGVANAFQATEADTYYVYNVNAHWSADNYDQYCFASLFDPALSAPWPIPLEEALVGDRDRRHPPLADVTPL